MGPRVCRPAPGLCGTTTLTGQQTSREDNAWCDNNSQHNITIVQKYCVLVAIVFVMQAHLRLLQILLPMRHAIIFAMNTFYDAFPV